MIMADVFAWTFIIVGLMTTIVAYWLLFEALWPDMVSRVQQRLLRRTGWSALLGLVLGIPGIAVGLAMAGAGGPVALMGLGLVSLLVLTGLMGSAALARHVGARMNTPEDGQQPWRCVLRGGTVLVICYVLPVAGWFVLAFSLAAGLGAVVMALWPAKHKAVTTESVADAHKTVNA